MYTSMRVQLITHRLPGVSPGLKDVDSVISDRFVVSNRNDYGSAFQCSHPERNTPKRVIEDTKRTDK